MNRPSFQFYPADWRNNANLRRCTEAARGAWMDVLCVLHDSDEYGVCRWPLVELARAAGVPIKLLKELADKQVLKGADAHAEAYTHTTRHAGQDGETHTLIPASEGPCWYSSRLVRDEWVRTRRGSNTRFTPENQPPNPPPTRRVGGGQGATMGSRSGDGPSSSSSSSSSDIAKAALLPERRPASIELAETYFADNGSSAAEAAKFYDHFEANGWKQGGRTPLKSWQAAARNWIRRCGELIPAGKTRASYTAAEPAFDPSLPNAHTGGIPCAMPPEPTA